jgi:glycosyltransferase involved in cell wall biosynthesis
MRLSERLAVKLSHVVIADSRAIKAYLDERYKAKNVAYIPYGARELLNSDISPKEELEILQGFGLSTGGYYLDVGRIVAENNIHMEVEGFKRSKSDKKLVIIGNFDAKDVYTRYLFKLSNNNQKIVLQDAIYDKKVLGVLRKNCYAYINSREVCGTGPSLLEQMLFGRPVIAYDVVFHREVLQGGGIYFRDEDSLASAIGMLESGKVDLQKIAEWQARRIEEEYNWDNVAEKYSSLFRKLVNKDN